MTGFLTPKSSGIRHFFFSHDSRCVPRPLEVSSGSSLSFLPTGFGRRLKLPEEHLRKEKWCTPIVARVALPFVTAIRKYPLYV